MKPFSLSVLLLLSTLAAQAEVVMVSGTVYDVGKGAYSYDSNAPGGDNLLCWAATASNLLQHWQDEYLPADATNVPNGYATTVYTQPSGTRYLNIYNTISANVANTRSDLNTALTWYGNGTMAWDDASQSYVTVSGGYLRDYGLMAKQWVWSTGYSNSFHSMEEFKNLLDTAFRYNGYGVFLSMEVDHQPNSGHAITCWGYETDDSTGDVTALYVTDSDDHQFGARRVEVTRAADGGLSFSSEYNNFSGTETNYISGVSYITSVRATNERTDNTTLPTDGVLTGAVNISGQTIESATGISAEAGSILAAASEETTLSLGPSAGYAEGSGLVVKVGAMLTLDKTDLSISRFAGNGLSVAAEAGVRNGSVSITDNGGHGVSVQGAESDVTTFLQMSGNSKVEAARNGGDGIYVEGRMLLHDNRVVSLADNDGAGISVKGSLSTQSKYTTGLSTLDITSNDKIEITGNKQGGIYAQSTSSNGHLYNGEVAFSGNKNVLVKGNTATSGGGAYVEGKLFASNNTSVTFENNTATSGGGITAYRNGSINLSQNDEVSFKGNISTGKGGAVYASGSIVISGNTKSVDIIGNSAVDAAAVYANTDIIGGYRYSSSVSLDHNAAVNIKDNVASGANIIYNHGGAFSLSYNGAVQISGNNAGSGSVIHNDWAHLQAASGGYYLSALNPVIEIAHNSSVTFSGNTAQYDVYNRNVAYILADKGQTITFQHGFKNEAASNAWPATSGGTTYLGKDAAGNVSEGGTYIFKDGGSSVTMETTVATVNAGGGMVFSLSDDKGMLSVSSAELQNVKYVLSNASLRLSDVAFVPDSSLTVDLGYYAENNSLSIGSDTTEALTSLVLGSDAPKLMIDLNLDLNQNWERSAATGLETENMRSFVAKATPEATITLKDFLLFDLEAYWAQVDASLTLSGKLTEDQPLAIDVSGTQFNENTIFAKNYVFDHSSGSVLYYMEIPEPATATLSLLALAALAARRRRKA